MEILVFIECQKALYFVMRGDAGRVVVWDRVGREGGFGGIVTSIRRAHMQKLLVCTAFCSFCVREARSTTTFLFLSS